MNWFGFVAVLLANTVEHVRTIVVSDCRKFREEKLVYPYQSTSRLSLTDKRCFDIIFRRE